VVRALLLTTYLGARALDTSLHHGSSAKRLPLVLTERQRKPCISADCEAVDASVVAERCINQDALASLSERIRTEARASLARRVGASAVLAFLLTVFNGWDGYRTVVIGSNRAWFFMKMCNCIWSTCQGVFQRLFQSAISGIFSISDLDKPHSFPFTDSYMVRIIKVCSKEESQIHIISLRCDRADPIKG
jgi:hypothetical protein